jgi:hypothetical protein
MWPTPRTMLSGFIILLSSSALGQTSSTPMPQHHSNGANTDWIWIALAVAAAGAALVYYNFFRTRT